MEDEIILKIEQYLDGQIGKLPFATGDEIGQVIDYASGRNRYIGYLISLATHSYKDKKVALDCANGSTWMIAKSVFDALGAETHVIGNTPNGININDGVGSTHMDYLQAYVKDHHMDVGFAFDGDADRCLAVDENGNLVDGDKILYLYSCYMKERDKLDNNTVVTTVMSNFGLYKALDQAGIQYEKTNVGDKYVYENMRENGHMIGGEQSGHIIFAKYATTGDGMLTAIKIMQAMLSKKLPLSELVRDVTVYPQVLKNVKVTNKDDALQNVAVCQTVDEVTKKLGEQGRILLRKSGTEPVLRIMVEAPTHEICEEYVEAVITVMASEGLLIEVKQ